MAEYKVNTNLRHDGKLYKPGAKIKLDDEIAKRLVSEKAIEPMKVKGK